MKLGVEGSGAAKYDIVNIRGQKKKKKNAE